MCTAGASYLGHGQVYSDKAREAFPSGKRCRKTVGPGGFAYRENVLFQFQQYISRTQGKNCEAQGHEFTRSLAPRPGHCLPKLLPAPEENSLGKAGKSTPLHSTSE